MEAAGVGNSEWSDLRETSRASLVAGDLGSIPRLGRSLEEEMATHSSILAWKIPMDREAWQAAAHGVAKSWTQLNDIHACTHSTALTKAASVRQPPAPEREDKQLKSNPPCCKALPATSTITHNKSKVPLACKALPTMSKITHNKSKVQ